MARQLKQSEVNHLRRLLGYVRCEIWQTTDEMADTYRRIAPYLKETPSAEAIARVKADYLKAANVPQYVRAAVKALEKIVKEIDGEVIDADNSAAKALSGKPLALR